MADSKFEDRLRQPDAQQGNEDEKARAPQEGPSVDEGARERQSDEVKGRAPGPRARGGRSTAAAAQSREWIETAEDNEAEKAPAEGVAVAPESKPDATLEAVTEGKADDKAAEVAGPDDAAQANEAAEGEAETAPAEAAVDEKADAGAEQLAAQGAEGQALAQGADEARTQGGAQEEGQGEGAEGGAGPVVQVDPAAPAATPAAAAPAPAAAPPARATPTPEPTLAVARPEALTAAAPVQTGAHLEGGVVFQAAGPSAVQAAAERTGGGVAAVDPADLKQAETATQGQVRLEIEQFKQQAEQRKQTLAAARQQVQPLIDQGRNEALGRLAAARDAQRAAIAQTVAQAKATSRQAAAGAKSGLDAELAKTKQQIATDSAAARAQIERTHTAEVAALAKVRVDMEAKVAQAHAQVATQTRAVGTEKGSKAKELAAARASQYAAQPIPQQSGVGSFFNGGDYEKNKHDAKVQAARQVGEAYAKEFERKAAEAATAIEGAQSQLGDGFKQYEQQQAQALGAQRDGALRQIDASEQSSLAAADGLHAQKIQAIDGALQGTLAKLTDLQNRQQAAVDQGEAQQRQGIEAAASRSAADMLQTLDDAVAGVDQAVGQTVAQVEGLEKADAAQVKQALAQALGQIDQAVAQAQQIGTQGGGAFQQQAAQQAAAAEQGLSQLATQTATEAEGIVQGFTQAVQGERQGGQGSLGELASKHKGTCDTAQAGAVEGMGKTRADFQAGCERVLGNLTQKLGTSKTELGQDFDKALGNIGSEITKQADEAAGKVQPAWKSVVAFVLKLVIAIIVTVAIVLLAASGVGLLATIGLAALIGAVGGVAKMAVDKWATGESITLADVGKAAALGAVEGLISLAGAGIGGAVTKGFGSMVASKFGEQALKTVGFKIAEFAVDVAVGTAIDTIGSGVSDTLGRLIEGKEVSWATFGEAMKREWFTNLLGNAGGSLLAPVFGRALSKLGIGKGAGQGAAAETTKAATKEAEKAIVEQTTKQAEKAVVEQATKQAEQAVVEQTTKQAEKSVVEQTTKQVEQTAVEQTTKQTEQAVVAQTTKQAEQTAVEQTAKQTEQAAVEQTTKQTEQAAVTQTTKQTEQTAVEQTTKQTEQAAVTQTTKQTEQTAVEQTTKQAEQSAVADGAKRPPAGQHSGDLDQLYKDAAVAQKELSDVTNDIASKTGGRPVIPEKLKGRARAQEKIDTEYGGDASRLTDLARSSIEYKKLDDVYKGLESLKGQYEIVKIKDRFQNPTAGGYRDILLTVRMSNGHICEVQLHLEQVLEVKGGPGHAIYEQLRSIEAQAVKEGRALSADELLKIDALNKESRRLYDEAYASALGGGEKAAVTTASQVAPASKPETVRAQGPPDAPQRVDQGTPPAPTQTQAPTTTRPAQGEPQRVEQAPESTQGPKGGEKALPPLRQEYVDAVASLKSKVETLRGQGKADEEIARLVHAERRALGEKYKGLTPPDLLAKIYERNLGKYGDKLGPTIEWLRGQGKTWTQIIDSATRSGGKDLGF
jgi:hypothetical protein